MAVELHILGVQTVAVVTVAQAKSCATTQSPLAHNAKQAQTCYYTPFAGKMRRFRFCLTAREHADILMVITGIT